MISFDSLELGCDADKTKQDLYELFFVWKASQQQQQAAGVDMEGKTISLADGEKEGDEDIKIDTRQEEEAKNELRKKEQLKKEQDLIEFEKRGGFVRVLKDIFNPTDIAAMQLDSVY